METLSSLMDILGKIKPLVDILTLIFVVIYVWKTWHIASATKESAKATEKSADISRKTLEEMKEARDQDTAPYIFVYLDIIVGKQDIYLFVKNVGKSIANNVKLEFDPPLEISSPKYKISDRAFIKDGISSMPPGYEIKTLFDSAISYFDNKKNLPLTYKVKISYSGGIEPKTREVRQTLDLSVIKGLIYEKEKTMTNLVNKIEELTKSVNSIAEKLDKHPNSEITEDVFDTEKSRSDTQESDNTKSAK
jgi:hypothetical protein